MGRPIGGGLEEDDPLQKGPGKIKISNSTLDTSVGVCFVHSFDRS